MNKLCSFILLLLLFGMVQYALSQPIDYYASQPITTLDKATYKSIRKQFRESKEYALFFHYDKCTFAGLEYKQFDRFMHNIDPKATLDSCYLSNLLLCYEARFYKQHDVSNFVKGNARSTTFTIHITIDDISVNAGIKAKALLMYHDSIPVARFDASMEDGRWNTFPILLLENGTEQALKLAKSLYVIRRSQPLYQHILLIRKE